MSNNKDGDTDGKEAVAEPSSESDVSHQSDIEVVVGIVHTTCLLLSVPWSLLVDMNEGHSNSQGVQHLLTPQYRLETAQYVNAAMLRAAGLPAVPRLHILLQWVRLMEEKEQNKEESSDCTEADRSGPPLTSMSTSTNRRSVASIPWPTATGTGPGPSTSTPTAADVVTLNDVLLGPRLLTGGLALPPPTST